jgi:predicted dehydrogenase
MNRRSFIQNIAIAGVAAGLPPRLFAAAGDTDTAGTAAAAKNPSQKIRIAYIGIGNQGAADIRQFEKTGLTEVVALCDTELGHHRTVATIKQFPKAKLYRDFRRLLDENARDLDAVLVATPDFSHFPAAMLALSLGLHVYVEKPVAHTFDQIDLLIAAAAKYKTRTGAALVTQMGNQGHSSANYYQFKAWAEAGVLKNITRINAHMNNDRRWHWAKKPEFRSLDNYFPAERAPDWLDWNAWLATASDHPCSTRYLDGEWRCWFDFGNGALGDWGAHICDTAHEFLRLGYPAEVAAVKLDGWNKFVFPQATTLQFKFPARDAASPALDLWWYDGMENLPPLPAGAGAIEEDKSIPTPGGGTGGRAKKNPPPGKELYRADGAIFQGGSHGSVLKQIAGPGAGGNYPDYRKDKPDAHYGNFLRSILGEEQPHSPFAVSGPLCQTMAIGIIAQRVCRPGETLKFDAKTKRITNNAAANALLTHIPPRAGWEQFYKL